MNYIRTVVYFSIVVRLCKSSTFSEQEKIEIEKVAAPLLTTELKDSNLPEIMFVKKNSTLLSLIKPKKNATYKLWGRLYNGYGFDVKRLMETKSKALEKVIISQGNPVKEVDPNSDIKSDTEVALNLIKSPSNSSLQTNAEEEIYETSLPENSDQAYDNEVGINSDRNKYLRRLANFTEALINSLRNESDSESGVEDDPELLDEETEVTPAEWEVTEDSVPSTVPTYILQQATELPWQVDDYKLSRHEDTGAGYDSKDDRVALSEQLSGPADAATKSAEETIHYCWSSLSSYVDQMFNKFWISSAPGKGRGRRKKKGLMRILMPMMVVMLKLKLLLVTVGALATAAGKSALLSVAALVVAAVAALRSPSQVSPFGVGATSLGFGLHRGDGPESGGRPATQHLLTSPSHPGNLGNLYLR